MCAASAAKSGRIVRAGWRQGLVASGWLLGAVAYAIDQGWIAASRGAVAVIAVAGVTTLITGLYYRRRLGGITGDFLGATEQLGEMAILAVLCVAELTKVPRGRSALVSSEFLTALAAA